ncbi:MAG: Hsp20/alpha crystallin family protein [Prevotella sp.]|nr:Hsp20/alpha crystallin family protein [Prevotella sp.]
MLPIYAKTSNQGFFPSFFNDFFNDSWITPQFHSTSPAINVSEDDKGYKVEIAAPGMTKEDFNVSISDGDIVIAMEKKNENKDENKEKKYIRREFSYSKYEQRLALPDNVEKQNITAQMTDGVLYIDIPKMTPEEKAKECQCIEIK